MGQCGLLEVRSRLVGQLSRGFRQRVALAAALVPNPRALILDEPGTGLDPIQQLTFRTLVRELAEDRAILLSTHHVGEAVAMCDELLVIVGGRIVAQGEFGALRNTKTSEASIVVELQGIDAASLLGGLPGVQSVAVNELPDGWVRAECTCTGDGRAEIHAAVTAAGGGLRELRLADDSVEKWLRGLLEGTPA
jgi:ABC-2 type transport system ATP-binding protein